MCQLSRQLSGKIIFNYDVYALFHGTPPPSPLPPPPLPRATSLVMLKVFTYLFSIVLIDIDPRDIFQAFFGGHGGFSGFNFGGPGGMMFSIVFCFVFVVVVVFCFLCFLTNQLGWMVNVCL